MEQLSPIDDRQEFLTRVAAVTANLLDADPAGFNEGYTHGVNLPPHEDPTQILNYQRKQERTQELPDAFALGFMLGAMETRSSTRQGE